MELMANENAPGGQPYIEWVTATVLRDFSDATHAFERGIIDAFIGQTADLGRFRAAGKNSSGVIPGEYLDFVGFNHNRTIFADIQMRQAVESAINGQFVQTVEILGDLGYAPGEDGILQIELSPVLPPVILSMTIIVNIENPRTYGAAQALYNELKTAGVAAILYTLNPVDFHARLYGGDFDLAVGTISIQNRLDFEFLRMGNREAGNFFGHSSTYFNRLMDYVNLAPNEEALAAASANLKEYIYENLPIISLGFNDKMLFMSSRLHGNLTPSGGDIFRNASLWFIVDSAN
jgi:ABC-type transport system substrate-binding protein